MMKTAVVLVCLPLLFLATSVPSHAATDDLAGRWTVIWDNNSKNNLSLENKDGLLSGKYQNDKKESCSVTGKLAAPDRNLGLKIVCSGWNIEMQGAPSKDSRTLTGTYQAYGSTSGAFSMIRQ
jgi:hypothetical protein